MSSAVTEPLQARAQVLSGSGRRHSPPLLHAPAAQAMRKTLSFSHKSARRASALCASGVRASQGQHARRLLARAHAVRNSTQLNGLSSHSSCCRSTHRVVRGFAKFAKRIPCEAIAIVLLAQRKHRQQKQSTQRERTQEEVLSRLAAPVDSAMSGSCRRSHSRPARRPTATSDERKQCKVSFAMVVRTVCRELCARASRRSCGSRPSTPLRATALAETLRSACTRQIYANL